MTSKNTPDEAMAELLVRGRTRVGDVEVVLAAPVEAVVDLGQVIRDGSLSQSFEDADRDGVTTHIYHDGARVASIVPSGGRSGVPEWVFRSAAAAVDPVDPGGAQRNPSFRAAVEAGWIHGRASRG